MTLELAIVGVVVIDIDVDCLARYQFCQVHQVWISFRHVALRIFQLFEEESGPWNRL
jgi:hypothetical protein